MSNHNNGNDLSKEWLNATPDLTGDNWEVFIKNNKIIGLQVKNTSAHPQSYVYDIVDGMVVGIFARNAKDTFTKLGQVSPETRKARHMLGDVVESEGYLVQIDRAINGPFKNTCFSGAIAAGNPQLGKAVLEQLNLRKPGTPTQPLTRDEALNLAAHFHKVGNPDEAKRKINAQKVNVKRLELPFKKAIFGNIHRLPPLPRSRPTPIHTH
jgi:hypothetical protein